MFYCTAGRGTEVFVAQELSSRSIDNSATVTDGKVYFKCDQTSFHKLKQLKSVERVFVQIEHCKSSDLDVKGTDRHELVSGLKEKLVHQEHLSECLQTFRTIAGNKKEEESELNEPLCKRPKVEDDMEDTEDTPTFRVSSKVAGKWKHLFRARNFQELSQHLGREIVQKLGWRVELRNPEFEICVHVNDTTVCAGIPITRQPVSKRDYIVKPGLRSTVSWILAHLADIQTGDVILDPMCGKSTVLVEAAVEYKNCHFLGYDLDPEQLRDSAANRESAGLKATLSLGLADVTRLPLRDASVDKVVCDAPFGQKHSINMDVKDFYKLLLGQIYRVLKPGGQCVLMTSAGLKTTVQEVTSRGSSSDPPDLVGTLQEGPQDSTPDARCEDTNTKTSFSGSKVDTDSRVKTESKVEPCSMIGLDSKGETDPRIKGDSKVDTNSRVETDSRVKTDSKVKKELSIETDSNFKTDPNVKTDQNVETDSKCETDSRVKGDSQEETNLKVETDVMVETDSIVDQSESTIVTVTPRSGEVTTETISTSDPKTQANQSSHFNKQMEDDVKRSSETQKSLQELCDANTRVGSKNLNLELVEEKSCFSVNSEHYIKLGETHAFIFVLRKDK